MSGPKTAAVVFAAGLAAIICVARFGLGARGLIEAFTAAVLVVLSVIDYRRRIIPNVIVLPAAAIVFFAQLAFFPHHALEWTIAALACAAFFFIPHVAYPEGMGMGDVKLALLLGAALGKAVIGALFVGLLAGALVGVAMILIKGAEARKTKIPYGPFLAAGALVILFFG
jgi:leader peptidase (prepilin peptidase)/N-methyltransferase